MQITLDMPTLYALINVHVVLQLKYQQEKNCKNDCIILGYKVQQQ